MRAYRFLAAALVASAHALPSIAQEVVLKVHHFWPPGAMPPSTILVPWCDKIAKDSGNKMKCQIYPAMQLGGTPQNLIDQAKDGVVDIVWTLPGYTAGRFPLMEVFELPFMSSQRRGDQPGRRGSTTPSTGNKEFPGLKALAVNVHDNGYIHTNPHQVKVMADFKGLRMRAPTRQTNKMLAALGATPVAMPLPALVRGDLQRRGRRLPAAVGSHPVDQGARTHQVRKRNRSQVAGAVHRRVHARDEPGEVRQPSCRPQESDRRQFQARRCRSRWACNGTRRRPPRASSRWSVATRST